MFKKVGYQSVLLLTTSTVVFSIHSKRSPIYNDSPGGQQAPRPQGLILRERRKTTEDVSQSEAKSLSPAVLEQIQPEGKLSAEAGASTRAWASFSSTISDAGTSISSFEWSSMGDKITDFIIPEWAQALPRYLRKLQHEIEMAPGSMADEVWQETEDTDINPEITWNATVRLGKELCVEEKTFQWRRKQHTTKALARYLDVPEEDIDPEDVPTIAMCGSGGGLRALVAGAGSYLSAQEAGLFDCVTYTAGVSGSCWLQTLYNSSLSGRRHNKLIEHLKKRIGVHIAFPPAALDLLTTAPTNKFLLSGVIEKIRGDPEANFGLVDIYGVLLAARLLVPKGELGVNALDLKLSNQRMYVDNGTNPLPIYTAVRHEIPVGEYTSAEEKASGGISDATKERAKQESWFQWFETTPYEFWCEELDAGIPTWSVGRKFQDGQNIPRENGLGLPELRVPQLLGIWGSAFCATLSHYYKEIRPAVVGLAGWAGIDELMSSRNDDLVKVHPIEPAAIPNFALGLEGLLSPTCPKSIYSATHLQLMDAGMSNNLPIYPLLRPGRNVDILVAFDASADIKTENWLSVADGYARQRGIRGWPLGVGWPKEDASRAQTSRELEAAQAATPQEANSKVADAREQQRESAKNATEEVVSEKKHVDPSEADLSYCTIWVGTTTERTSTTEPPPSKRMDPEADWELLGPDAGIAVIYFPFLPNPKVEGVDPNTSEFMSTWNFIYTPEEIDKVVALARANFEEGKEQTRRCVRAVYERKRRIRLEREGREREAAWRRRWRQHGDHFR